MPSPRPRAVRDVGVEEWALDRIEEAAAPYHDWAFDDVPVLPDDVDFRLPPGGEGAIEVFRAGQRVAALRTNAGTAALVQHLQERRPMPVGQFAVRASVPAERLCDALREMEKRGLVMTELALRCARGGADEHG